MKTIELNIPEDVKLNAKEAAMLLANRLYEEGKISLEQGAEMPGFSKRDFMERLVGYGVSV